MSDDDKNSNEIVSVPVRDMEEFPKKYCVTYEELLPNVKYFYEHGGMNPEYNWDKMSVKSKRF